MAEINNYNWLRKLIEKGNWSIDEFSGIVNKHGMMENARNIGTIRKNFLDKCDEKAKKIFDLRRHLLQKTMDKSIIAGEASSFMFPMVQEEFCLDPEFLKYAFPLPGFPVFLEPVSTRVVAIGSCFASNISNTLRAKNLPATHSHFAEDINSPLGLLSLLVGIQDIDGHTAAMQKYYADIIEEDSPDCAWDVKAIHDYIDHENKRMSTLLSDLQTCNCVILTLGNSLEWCSSIDLFSELKVDSWIAMEIYNTRLKGIPGRRRVNDFRRQASHALSSSAISASLKVLRSFTESPIICTVSPIPIRGISGLSGDFSRSAISENNLCKSTLRSALNEVMCNDELKNVFYFPSFEIATEVAQRIPGLGFGNDDSNSRHLDQEIIKGICDFFVFKCFPSSQ